MNFPRIYAKHAEKLLSSDRLAMYYLCRMKATASLWRFGTIVYEYDATTSKTVCEDFIYEDWAQMCYRDFLDLRTASLMEWNGYKGIILFFDDIDTNIRT